MATSGASGRKLGIAVRSRSGMLHVMCHSTDRHPPSRLHGTSCPSCTSIRMQEDLLGFPARTASSVIEKGFPALLASTTDLGSLKVHQGPFTSLLPGYRVQQARPFSDPLRVCYLEPAVRPAGRQAQDLPRPIPIELHLDGGARSLVPTSSSGSLFLRSNPKVAQNGVVETRWSRHPRAPRRQAVSRCVSTDADSERDELAEEKGGRAGE